MSHEMSHDNYSDVGSDPGGVNPGGVSMITGTAGTSSTTTSTSSTTSTIGFVPVPQPWTPHAWVASPPWCLPSHHRNVQPATHVDPEHLRLCLLNFFYNDITSIVLSYTSSIELTLVATLGSRGRADGEFLDLNSLCLVNGELFSCEGINARIQVFDEISGRFLRSWGGGGSGIIACPQDVACDGVNVFVLDYVEQNYNEIKVFSVSDGKLLQCFKHHDAYSSLCLDQKYIYLSVTSFFNHKQCEYVKVCSKIDGTECKVIGKDEFNTCGRMFLQDQELFVVDEWASCVLVFNTQTTDLMSKYIEYSRLNPKEKQEQKQKQEERQGGQQGEQQGEPEPQQENQEEAQEAQEEKQKQQKEHKEKNEEKFDNFYLPTAIFVYGNQVIISEARRSRLIVLDKDTGKQSQTLHWLADNGLAAKAFDMNKQKELLVADSHNERILVFK